MSKDKSYFIDLEDAKKNAGNYAEKLKLDIPKSKEAVDTEFQKEMAKKIQLHKERCIFPIKKQEETKKQMLWRPFRGSETESCYQYGQSMSDFVRLTRLSPYAYRIVEQYIRSQEGENADEVVFDCMGKVPNNTRLKTALEAMRSIGYLTETTFLETLYRFGELDECLQNYFDILVSNDYEKHIKELNKRFEKNADDYCMMAIEVISLIYDSEHFLTMPAEAVNTFFIKKHISEVYGLVVWIAWSSFMCEKHESKKEEQQKLKSALKEKDDLERKVKISQNELKTANFKVTALDEKCAKLSQANLDLEAKIQALEKEMVSLKKENDQLKAEAKKEIQYHFFDSSFYEDSEETSCDIDEIQEEISELEEQYDDFDDIEIPEDKSVVFLGGSPNLVKKIRDIHPGWRYISDESSAGWRALKNETASVKLLILYSKHISHSLCQAVRNSLGSDVPIIYLNSDNPQMAEKVIYEDYKHLLIKDGIAV